MTYFIFIELLVSIIFCICYATLLGMWYGFLYLSNNFKYNILIYIFISSNKAARNQKKSCSLWSGMCAELRENQGWNHFYKFEPQLLNFFRQMMQKIWFDSRWFRLENNGVNLFSKIWIEFFTCNALIK